MYEITNGRYKVSITPAGGGQSMWTWIALSRWVEDPVEDCRGFFLYVRDLDSKQVWSAGLKPSCAKPDSYEVWAGDGRHVIERLDHGMVLRVDTAVAGDDDFEVRRVALENRSNLRRRLELTSFVEVALAHPMGDLGHPAFSKLFVQTERRGAMLTATRRPRSQDERWPVMYHAVVGREATECETDRLQFVGRGRTALNPVAMSEGSKLSCTVGNVLDPVMSLRVVVELEPGASEVVSFVLGAADEVGKATAAVTKLRDPDYAARLYVPVALKAVEAPELVHPLRTLPVEPAALAATEELRHFNGIGGFNADGSEYVMRLEWQGGALKLPPMPWTNVLANPQFGCVISETGASCTWSRNSQALRVTPWSNDPVSDPHQEAWYIRDEADGACWSPLPGPIPAPVSYEASHGRGWSRFSSVSNGLFQDVTVFVPAEPVKIVRLALTNRSEVERRLSVFSYQRVVLGSIPQVPSSIKTWKENEVLLAQNTNAGEFADTIAFSRMVVSTEVARHTTCDRLAFLGAQGSAASPAALLEPFLSHASGLGVDPCFAHQVLICVAPGERWECCLILGAVESQNRLGPLLAEFDSLEAVERSLTNTREHWQHLLNGVHVTTPVPEIDLMVNGWLAYQALACRIWGRTAFYQSSGAWGFRDQLQDAGNLLMMDPKLTRDQILRHAAHQFEEGDVLHWWHDEPLGRGVRTRFADDLLWLPLVVLRYVAWTGDEALWDVSVPFLRGEELKPGQEENYFKPETSTLQGSIYEHCRRAILRSLQVGAHGLPLMGTGDWNDGMNRVGREGRGESVWMGFFLYEILGQFVPTAKKRGDHDLAQLCERHREDLHQALNSTGWDAEWYRRAYFDNGTPLGTASADECKIDGLAQSWAVLSGVAEKARSDQAMDAVQERRIVEDPGLIKLLAPPFNNMAEDPGYIKGYVAGVRENGGQYTHAACWVVMASAALRRRDTAAHLLKLISPAWHTRNAVEVERYKVEPYVIAADVYGVEPHLGRGGWTWYTGSAGWAWRAAVESVLGVRLEGGGALVIEPCIPDSWPEYTVDYRHPIYRCIYHIVVRASNGSMEAPMSVTCDGLPGVISGRSARLPIHTDDKIHQVIVTMGKS